MARLHDRKVAAFPRTALRQVRPVVRVGLPTATVSQRPLAAGDAPGGGFDQSKRRDLAASQPSNGFDRGHASGFVAHPNAAIPARAPRETSLHVSYRALRVRTQNSGGLRRIQATKRRSPHSGQSPRSVISPALPGKVHSGNWRILAGSSRKFRARRRRRVIAMTYGAAAQIKSISPSFSDSSARRQVARMSRT